MSYRACEEWQSICFTAGQWACGGMKPQLSRIPEDELLAEAMRGRALTLLSLSCVRDTAAGTATVFYFECCSGPLNQLQQGRVGCQTLDTRHNTRCVERQQHLKQRHTTHREVNDPSSSCSTEPRCPQTRHNKDGVATAAVPVSSSK